MTSWVAREESNAVGYGTIYRGDRPAHEGTVGLHGDKTSIRFEYEHHDADGQWFRTHGNEHWEFDDNGLMARRDMSANDVPIKESERRYTWER